MSDYGQSAEGRVEAHRQNEIHIQDQPANSFHTQEDKTATYVIGTVYQNTTGKPLIMAVTSTNSGGGTAIDALSDAANPPTTLVSRSGWAMANNSQVHLDFVVLPGHYFKVQNLGGGSSTTNVWTRWY